MVGMRLRVAAALTVIAFVVTSLAADARADEAPPAAAVAETDVPLQLRAYEPDVMWLLKTGRKDLWKGPRVMFGPGPHLSRITVNYFEQLCFAPCAVQLPPGTYVFGLTEGSSRILESEPVTLRGNELLTGRWVSRRAFRVGGSIVGLLSVLVGFVRMIKKDDATNTHPQFWLGLGLMVGGGALMVVSQLQRDRAEIEVYAR